MIGALFGSTQNLYGVRQDQTLYVVPPGEHYFWPGEYVGRKFVLPDVTLPDGSPITLEVCSLVDDLCLFPTRAQTLSLEPRVFLLEKFVSDDECQQLIASAEPLLIPSKGFERTVNTVVFISLFCFLSFAVFCTDGRSVSIEGEKCFLVAHRCD